MVAGRRRVGGWREKGWSMTVGWGVGGWKVEGWWLEGEAMEHDSGMGSWWLGGGGLWLEGVRDGAWLWVEG